jgi:hypothetical protein
MRLAFIVSPYRADDHTVAEHEEIARRMCEYARRRGYTPIAPHLLFPQILDDAVPEERDAGMAFGLSILESMRCYSEYWIDTVFVYASHNITTGMACEMKLAYANGVRVEDVTEWDLKSAGI